MSDEERITLGEVHRMLLGLGEQQRVQVIALADLTTKLAVLSDRTVLYDRVGWGVLTGVGGSALTFVLTQYFGG